MAVFELTVTISDPATGETGTGTAAFVVETAPASTTQKLDEVQAILNA